MKNTHTLAKCNTYILYIELFWLLFIIAPFLLMYYNLLSVKPLIVILIADNVIMPILYHLVISKINKILFVNKN